MINDPLIAFKMKPQLHFFLNDILKIACKTEKKNLTGLERLNVQQMK